MSNQDDEFDAWLRSVDAEVVESIEAVVDTEASLLRLKQEAAQKAVAVAHASGSDEPDRAIRSVLVKDQDLTLSEEETRHQSVPGPVPASLWASERRRYGRYRAAILLLLCVFGGVGWLVAVLVVGQAADVTVGLAIGAGLATALAAGRNYPQQRMQRRLARRIAESHLVAVRRLLAAERAKAAVETDHLASPPATLQTRANNGADPCLQLSLRDPWPCRSAFRLRPDVAETMTRHKMLADFLMKAALGLSNLPLPAVASTFSAHLDEDPCSGDVDEDLLVDEDPGDVEAQLENDDSDNDGPDRESGGSGAVGGGVLAVQNLHRRRRAGSAVRRAPNRPPRAPRKPV